MNVRWLMVITNEYNDELSYLFVPIMKNLILSNLNRTCTINMQRGLGESCEK